MAIFDRILVAIALAPVAILVAIGVAIRAVAIASWSAILGLRGAWRRATGSDPAGGK